jgi:hypothetical protein
MKECAMRVGLLTAGFLLTSAIISASTAATVTMSPPAPPQAQVQPKAQPKAEAKVACPPVGHQINRRTQARRAPRRPMRRYAGGYYNYRAAPPVMQGEWHGQWRAAPNDAFIPGPMAYDGPPPGYDSGYDENGVRVDDRGWTGGVGFAPDGGGGGGGFTDGFGQIHFANGGSVENGPTYNSINQSFQFNPSQAGPFQPRLMGGFAPPSR